MFDDFNQSLYSGRIEPDEKTMYRVLVPVFLLMFAGCIVNPFSPDDAGEGTKKITHYVAIDIDDIFMQVTDPRFADLVDVKMDEPDVAALIDLSDRINSHFGGNFAFSLGFCCGYYDSTNSGDTALVNHASEFRWFNHFPRHEHVVEYGLNSVLIGKLFTISNNFARDHGFENALSHYDVTPKHEGLWPPFQPLYDVFEENHITCVSTQTIDRPAVFGDVCIMKRQMNDLAAGDCSLRQESSERIDAMVQDAYTQIMNNKLSIVVTHQANYAMDRPAILLLSGLLDKLEEQKDYSIVFLPAEKLEPFYRETYFTLPTGF
jgi:hypothetical protein